VNHFFQW